MIAIAAAQPAQARPVLCVRDLEVVFPVGEGRQLTAVQKVSFDLKAGETLAIVGESGSGKSAMALSLLGLLGKPGRIAGGQVLYRGQNLATASQREMQSIRGRSIAMIFQDPMTGLDPLYQVGRQIEESLKIHTDLDRRQRRERVYELLTLVGISDAAIRAAQYPHQLSGGMRQRIMIAIALACNPEIIIADEPTTALDVTIQAQVLDLLDRLKREIGASVILISHDLGVVAHHADTVAVMYAGTVVELGAVDQVLAAPQHPYTRGLVDSSPSSSLIPRTPLRSIRGTVPNLLTLPPGCVFRNRCDHAMEICAEPPPNVAISTQQTARCWLRVSQDEASA